MQEAPSAEGPTKEEIVAQEVAALAAARQTDRFATADIDWLRARPGLVLPVAIVYALFTLTALGYDVWTGYLRDALGDGRADYLRAAQEKGPPAAPAKLRDGTFDFIRLCVQFVIVYEHTENFVAGQWTLETLPFKCRFKLCVFALLSGIFGHPVDGDHLSNVACYTLGTIIFTNALLVTTLQLVFPDIGNDGIYLEKWYLWALFTMRFIISPIFALAKRLEISRFVPFAVVWAGCLLIPNFFEPDFIRRFHPPVIMGFFFLGPFFAVGMLRPPQWWSETLADRRLQLAGLLLMAALYTANWCGWDAATAFVKSRNVLHPLSRQPWPGPTLFDALWFLFMDEVRFLAMALPTMFVLSGVNAGLEKFAPRMLVDALHGMGARSIFIYALHWPLSVPCLANILSLFPAPPSYPVVALVKIILPIHECLLWGGKFAELLFSWLVLPYWFKRGVIHAAEGLRGHGADGKQTPSLQTPP